MRNLNELKTKLRVPKNARKADVDKLLTRLQKPVEEEEPEPVGEAKAYGKNIVSYRSVEIDGRILQEAVLEDGETVII